MCILMLYPSLSLTIICYLSSSFALPFFGPPFSTICPSFGIHWVELELTFRRFLLIFFLSIFFIRIYWRIWKAGQMTPCLHDHTVCVSVCSLFSSPELQLFFWGLFLFNWYVCLFVCAHSHNPAHNTPCISELSLGYAGLIFEQEILTFVMFNYVLNISFCISDDKNMLCIF